MLTTHTRVRRVVRWMLGLVFFTLLYSSVLAAAGDLDTTFDGDGIVITNIGTSDKGAAVALQSDGKLVVVGVSGVASGTEFTVLRYNTNGSLDTTFSSDGIATTPVSSGDEWANAVVIQSDGKIVVAGDADMGSSYYDFAVVRYNTNGSLDTTFGGDGIVTTDIGGNTDMGLAVALQADGKIVVAGYGKLSSYDMAVVRYNSDGTLDTSFDDDGIVTTNIGGNDFANALVLQADGKIVAAGSAGADMAVVRYNTNGSLDTTFDGDGKVTTSIGSGDWANAMVLQPDGKLIAAGETWSGTKYDFALVRYNTNGSLDTTFDGDGKAITSVGTGDDYANALVRQPDGKIVVAGYTHIGSGNDFALVRYTSGGALDTTFSTDGIVTTNVGGDDIAYGMARQSDGKIVVAGYVTVGVADDLATVRYEMETASPLATTSTTITGHTPNPSNAGQAVVVSYTVNPSGGGTPTGNVTVGDGFDSCMGTVAAGNCTITLSTVGTRELRATYTGDSSFAASTSAGAMHTVNAAGNSLYLPLLIR